MPEVLQQMLNYVIAIYIRLSAEDGDRPMKKAKATALSISGPTSAVSLNCGLNLPGRRFSNFVMTVILGRTWSGQPSGGFWNRCVKGKSTASSSRICPGLGATISWLGTIWNRFSLSWMCDLSPSMIPTTARITSTVLRA